MTNLAARNKDLRSKVLHSVQETYPNLLLIPVPEDVNEVLVALSHDSVLHLGKQSNSVKKDTAHRTDLLSDNVKASVATLAGVLASGSSSLLNAKDLEEEWQTVLASLSRYDER